MNPASSTVFKHSTRMPVHRILFMNVQTFSIKISLTWTLVGNYVYTLRGVERV